MFSTNGHARVGVVDGTTIADVTSNRPDLPGDLLDWITLGAEALERLARLVDDAPRLNLADVMLLAPIGRPAKFLGIGGNFESHLAEVAHLGMTRPLHQIWFNKQTTCIAGPYDDIELPRVSSALDYEGELAIVIGTRCRHVTPEDAPRVIAGFTICNDVSVRDWQFRSPTATLGKSFDTHGPTGPWLVTSDELGDPHVLSLRTWVNGELRQSGNTAEMIFDCYKMIAELSTVFTLEPGDILATGTPAGVGAVKSPPVYLVAGDVVRVEIQGIGAIENHVVAEPEY